jgi:uncharacterized ferritin-like protein (DUF455 family)
VTAARRTGIMAAPMSDDAPPAPGTVERWAHDYVLSEDLEHKLAPPAPPGVFEQGPRPRRLARPGRPACLEVVGKARRSLRPGELREPHKRARLLHTFWHHELQAAELMCWAILAFPDTPRSFREGLLGICRDEIRHMGMYAGCLSELGSGIGAFPVRDWFWTRVPACDGPLQFVALLGLGLEGANLDHAGRYAEAFDAAGDARGAAVQRTVAREEIAHVRFAARWFAEWTGAEVEFERWRAALVAPLTPAMFRGRPLDRAARRAAGLSEDFVDALERFEAGSR